MALRWLQLNRFITQGLRTLVSLLLILLILNISVGVFTVLTDVNGYPLNVNGEAEQRTNQELLHLQVFGGLIHFHDGSLFLSYSNASKPDVSARLMQPFKSAIALGSPLTFELNSSFNKSYNLYHLYDKYTYTLVNNSEAQSELFCCGELYLQASTNLHDFELPGLLPDQLSLYNQSSLMKPFLGVPEKPPQP